MASDFENQEQAMNAAPAEVDAAKPETAEAEAPKTEAPKKESSPK